MPKTKPFNEYSEKYESWFSENKFVYLSELSAVKKFVPRNGRGMEIGVGSGQFAIPLGISIGVDPSEKMLELAKGKGVFVCRGVAEFLPFKKSSFDFALMVTTICFVDDLGKTLAETSRILKPGGCLILGFVDKNSSLGEEYVARKEESVFYRDAIFYSTDELNRKLLHAGFIPPEIVQTVFGELKEIHEVQKCRTGYGDGGFVVIKAILSPTF